MAKRIHVGNLDHSVTENDLRDLFGEFGEISRVRVKRDRETGRSKGFGFVEMDDDEEPQMAIDQLDGCDYCNKTIIVKDSTDE